MHLASSVASHRTARPMSSGEAARFGHSNKSFSPQASSPTDTLVSATRWPCMAIWVSSATPWASPWWCRRNRRRVCATSAQFSPRSGVAICRRLTSMFCRTGLKRCGKFWKQRFAKSYPPSHWLGGSKLFTYEYHQNRKTSSSSLGYSI